MRVGWRSATTTSGEQSVMTHLAPLKQQWFAGSLDTLQLVIDMHTGSLIQVVTKKSAGYEANSYCLHNNFIIAPFSDL